MLAEMRGAARMIDQQQKIRENKARAQELCSMALETANELFDTGDLSPYLSVLSRLHWYNYFNLLLILRQYPTATHLAAYNTWKEMIPPGEWILKQEHKGKGIELIAPWTNLQPQGTRSLSWYSFKQFDVAQTNVKNFVPEKGIYLEGPPHVFQMCESLRRVLDDEHEIVVLRDQMQSQPDLPGYIKDKRLYIRPGLTDAEQIQLLSEHLIRQTNPETVTGERHLRTFLLMAQHCLLQIWGIPGPPLIQNRDLIRSTPADLRPAFLDLMQRTVRHIEESAHSKYMEILQAEKEEKALLDWTSL